MHISAIYIHEHKYLIDKPTVINFGSKYIYEAQLNKDVLTFKRHINKNFHENFFKIDQNGVELLTAIVGGNGAGKTTILNIIRQKCISNFNALPYCDSVLIFEDLKHDCVYCSKSNFSNILLDDVGTKEIPIVESSFRTIYYNPHFDFTFNPYFSEVDDHDISFDTVLNYDLNAFQQKEPIHSPVLELIFKNSLRQIRFLHSELAKSHSAFTDLFNLPVHGDPELKISLHKSEEFHNTPRQFRTAIQTILDKIRKEENDWTDQQDENGDKSQRVVNKYLLKRRVLLAIIRSFIHQMEKRNFYLEEGRLDSYSDFLLEIKELNAYDALILFAKKATIMLPRDFGKYVFSSQNLKTLVDAIYDSIDRESDEITLSHNTFSVPADKVINILQLHHEFIQNLARYYENDVNWKKNLVLSETDRVSGFIEYSNPNKKLSSGENALLNLFSRLYDFLENQLSEFSTFRHPAGHYILLLDEGDLGFHPIWKKKYVKALLMSLPSFFEGVLTKPSLQIVFTTHDPLTLSDIPNSNVIYMVKEKDEFAKTLSIEDKNRPTRTFAANVSELLADSFFSHDSLIGEFAQYQIKKTVNWLGEKDNKKDSELYRYIISIIDEPIIQRKLAEMYDYKMEEKFQSKIIDDQIEMLNRLKNRLKR